jgi:hypothetical protein
MDLLVGRQLEGASSYRLHTRSFAAAGKTFLKPGNVVLQLNA